MKAWGALAVTFVSFSGLVATACGPQAGDVRIGTPRPARGPECALEFIATPSDAASFNKYDNVGMVRIGNAEANTDPMDESIRKIVRPRACALGGEYVSILGSGNATSRNGLRETAYMTYVVWVKRSATPQAPQRF